MWRDLGFLTKRDMTFQTVTGEREHEAGHSREGDGGSRRGGAGGGDQGVPDGAAVQGDAPRLVRGPHAEHEALLL